jgi:hypothetical protein
MGDPFTIGGHGKCVVEQVGFLGKLVATPRLVLGAKGTQG